MTGIDEARRLLADALETRFEDMPAEGRIGAIPGWDSLGHMRLVLTLESRLGRALAAQEIVNLKSVADVRKLLA